MFRRRRIKPERTDASANSLRATISDAVWAAQDRLRTGLGEVLRGSGEIVRRPLERTSWALRRGLIWPIEDRADGLSRPARALSFGVVVLLAAAAGVAGLIWAAPDGPNGPAATRAAATSPLAEIAASPAPAVAPEPTLHGAAPVFEPATGRPSEVDPAKAVETPSPKSSATTAAAATEKIASTASSSSAKAAAVDGPPAGPAAISVARDFAGAFVLYETGSAAGAVRRTFGETATPELSRSLLRRPPRLPANVEVPKAKVVNVVAGPSHGDVYTVSVALLRVGLTSELRLDMEQLKGERWRVTNVLG
jgi:hypothetical protein